jgi:hypothetical protein
MRSRHLLLRSAWWIAFVIGCNSESPAPPDAAPPDAAPPNESGLGDEPIPEDFTFQSTRPTELEVAAPSGGGEQEEARRLQVEVRSQVYGVMYRGSLVAGEAFRFVYPLPADVTELEVRTTDDSGVTTTQAVPVDASATEIILTPGGGA